MIGPAYWSTGIVIKYFDGEWSCESEFFDDGWCENASTEGVFRNRYAMSDLGYAIDTLKADMERAGISWKDPTLYVPGDGEDPDIEYHPEWQRIIREQCERIGWRNVYQEAE